MRPVLTDAHAMLVNVGLMSWLNQYRRSQNQTTCQPKLCPLGTSPSCLHCSEVPTNWDRKILSQAVIELAIEWAASIVFVTKTYGSLRFCVDYEKLNKLLRCGSYLIRRKNGCIDSLGEATVFSTLDVVSAYWHGVTEEEDGDETAFNSHQGLYRFVRMAFGVKISLKTMQQTMDAILASGKWKCAFIYPDEIVIFSKTSKWHIKHIRQALKIFQRASVTLEPKKGGFSTTTIDNLGRAIRPRRIKIDSHTPDAITHFQKPLNET